MVKDGHLGKIPDSMSFEDASTLGVAVVTGFHALYLTLRLPMPLSGDQIDQPRSILIYGGSTSIGTAAIQLAKLSVPCSSAAS